MSQTSDLYTAMLNKRYGSNDLLGVGFKDTRVKTKKLTLLEQILEAVTEPEPTKENLVGD